MRKYVTAVLRIAGQVATCAWFLPLYAIGWTARALVLPVCIGWGAAEEHVRKVLNRAVL